MVLAQTFGADVETVLACFTWIAIGTTGHVVAEANGALLLAVSGWAHWVLANQLTRHAYVVRLSFLATRLASFAAALSSTFVATLA